MDVMREMYEKMVLIRQFEERKHCLSLEGKMPGTIHLCMGREAVAAGVAKFNAGMVLKRLMQVYGSSREA